MTLKIILGIEDILISQSINIRLLKSMAGRRPKQHEIQCLEYTKVTGELSWLQF